jgi:RNA polymerase sigma-70 factor (ECF subfamily)
MNPASEVMSSGDVPAHRDDVADDVRLAHATVAGDASAFDQVVLRHHRRVFNFIHQLARQRQDAEDLTQQTFIKAFTHLARYDGSRPLINWLLTIARNNTLNHFRSVRPWTEIPDGCAGNEPSPATSAETRDRSDSLWRRARAVLSRRDYEILWLRFGEDLSVKEIAGIVALTETHVKVLIFRARLALQKEEQFK